MSLFTPLFRLQLNPDELKKVTLPIVGPGGAQGLLHVLNDRLKPTGELELEDDELQQVLRYSQYNDGVGGHQGRFRAVLSAAFRAGWVQP